MSTIVTRAGKGSPLTNTELDSNFTNLNTDKAELSGANFTGNLSLGDNVKAQFGASNDLEIYHDGSASYIADVGTGDLVLQAGNDLILRQPDGSTEYLRANEGAGVQIYHNGSQKFLTTAAGIDVTGSVVADGLTVANTGFARITLQDSDATNQKGYIDSSGGDLNLTSQNGTSHGDIFLKRYNGTSTVLSAQFASNGDISFYNDSAAQGLFWDSSTSRLGLGVTNPANKLEISGGNIRIINQSTGRITFNNGSTEAYFGFNGAGSSTLDSGSQPLQIQAQGSNYIQFDTNSAERLKINADGSSVFSGSVSASGKLSVSQSAAGFTGSLINTNSASDANGLIIQSGTQFSEYALKVTNTSGNTPFMQVRGDGAVQIPNGGLMVGATTAPYGSLHTQGTVNTAWTSSSRATDWIVTENLSTTASSYSGIEMIATGTGSAGVVNLACVDSGSGSGDFVVSTRNSGTFAEKMRISSAGLVSIKNTTAPTLRIENTDTGLTANETIGDIDFYQNDASGGGVGVVGKIRSINDSSFQGEASLAFHTGTTGGLTERFRISSDGSCRWTPDGTNHDMTLTADGNLLVGTTSSVSTSSSQTGAEMRANGIVVGAVNGNVSFIGNRIGSDGDIALFRKDGTTVGSIGIESSGFYLDGEASHAGLKMFAGAIGSRQNGSDVDATIDLGWSGGRFKDLYLSNKVYANYIGSFGDTNTNIYFPTGDQIRFITGGNERARIDASGNLLVGTTGANTYSSTVNTGVQIAPDFIGVARNQNTVMHLNRQGNDGTIVDFRTFGFVRGSVSISGSTTSYNTSSDERLKDNIKDSDDSGSKVDAIQVRQFDWKADGEHQDYGMVAQELLEVAPDAVTQGDTPDDMMGVDYSKLVPMLIKEIQSLRQRVAQLEE